MLGFANDLDNRYSWYRSSTITTDDGVQVGNILPGGT